MTKKRGRRQILTHNGVQGQICRRCNNWHPLKEFALNPSWCQKCMKEYQLIYRKEYKAKGKNAIAIKAQAAVKRAEAKSLPTLPEDQLKILIEYAYKLQKGLCYYTKVKLPKPGEQVEDTNYALSIEKFRPELGYTIGNVFLALNAVNTMKSNLSYNEFAELCDKVAKEKDTISDLMNL